MEKKMRRDLSETDSKNIKYRQNSQDPFKLNRLKKKHFNQSVHFLDCKIGFQEVDLTFVFNGTTSFENYLMPKPSMLKKYSSII